MNHKGNKNNLVYLATGKPVVPVEKVKVEFSNNFHNTETTAFVQCHTTANGKKYLLLSGRQAKRIFNDLCGSHDCTCSNALGERPSTDWQKDAYGKDFFMYI